MTSGVHRYYYVATVDEENVARRNVLQPTIACTYTSVLFLRRTLVVPIQRAQKSEQEGKQNLFLLFAIYIRFVDTYNLL